jgi:multidrug efflux pump subunit AcrA (membrane-fusion protein)
MKRTTWIVLALLLVMMVACGRGRETVVLSPTAISSEAAPPPTPPASGVTILAEGVVRTARPPLPLAFETGGVLLAVNMEVGDRVEPGDVVATLDDAPLQEAVTSASLQVAQAENSLAQVQLALDDLLAWEPDEMAVAVAEANLAAAEARYEMALNLDAAAGNQLTSAWISIEQAQRNLADVQEAYDIAWDPARDWELDYDEPICYPGQGGMVPCTGPLWKDRLEGEREATARALQAAQDSVTMAWANYNLTQASLNENSALDARAAVVNAEQALEMARSGPKESDITAARLRVEQATLGLEGSLFQRERAEDALSSVELVAPGAGAVLSVEAVAGAMVGAGTPIIILLDADQLEFHTVNLSERDLAQIYSGQTAVVVLKAYPDDPVEAGVLRIGLQAGPTIGDAATFPVMLGLRDSDLDIRPGMTGRVEIHSGE